MSGGPLAAETRRPPTKWRYLFVVPAALLGLLLSGLYGMLVGGFLGWCVDRIVIRAEVRRPLPVLDVGDWRLLRTLTFLHVAMAVVAVMSIPLTTLTAVAMTLGVVGDWLILIGEALPVVYIIFLVFMQTLARRFVASGKYPLLAAEAVLSVATFLVALWSVPVFFAYILR